MKISIAGVVCLRRRRWGQFLLIRAVPWSRVFVGVDMANACLARNYKLAGELVVGAAGRNLHDLAEEFLRGR